MSKIEFFKQCNRVEIISRRDAEAQRKHFCFLLCVLCVSVRPIFLFHMSKFLLFGVMLCMFLTACVPTAWDDYVPELIRPEAARLDTVVVDRGPVMELTSHIGVTRYQSESIYFINPIGNFDRFYVRTGDSVREGQVLARLITDHIEEQISDLRSRIAAMRRDNALEFDIRQVAIDIMVLNNAKAVADAAANLDSAAFAAAEAGALAIERAKLDLELEKERRALALRHQEERLRNLQNLLDYAELVAPFDGIITYMDDIQSGNYVGVARPLIYLSTGDEIIVEILGLTGMNFPTVGPGAPITWRPSIARDGVLARAYINGAAYDLVFMVTPVENRHFRPVQYEILSNSPLQAGLYFPVHFYTVRLEDVVRVPANAVFTGPGGVYVYRMIDGELVNTGIQMLARTTSMVAVSEGLEVGDVVFVRP